MTLRRSLRALAAAATGLGLLAAAAGPASAAVPAAPTALVVTFGPGGMRLAWTDSSADETGFAIERCFGVGCTAFGQIATVGADVTSYADTFYSDLPNFYRVRAVNASGSSGYSNVAADTLFSTGGTIARITASATAGTTPLTVTFDGSASTSINGAIGTYLWSFGDGATAAGAVVTHTYTTPGTYAATLKATSAVFAASNATAVIVTVTAPVVPVAAPTNLRATSPVRGQVRLAWTNPASSATSLAVERCSGSRCTVFTRIATIAPTATAYTDTTGRRGTTYRYRLAASDGVVTALSNVASVSVR